MVCEWGMSDRMGPLQFGNILHRVLEQFGHALPQADEEELRGLQSRARGQDLVHGHCPGDGQFVVDYKI
jgi:hypothetical protein